MNRHLGSAALLLAAACGRPEPPDPALVAAGEALLVEAQCVACHAPPSSPAAEARLPRRPGPDLAAAGSRLQPAWVRELLATGHHGAELDAAASADLAAFLAQRGELDRRAVVWSEAERARGEELYHGVGCVACHEPGAAALAAEMAAKTTLPALSAYLLDPGSVDRSGRSPAMGLDAAEARALAHFLLAGQAGGSAQRVAGLAVEVFEAELDPDEPDFTAHEPVARETVAEIGVEARTRDDLFGLRFRGELRVDRPGVYGFAAASDDGTWLSLDGARALSNGGVRPTKRVEAEVELDAGWHAFELLYVEARGEQVLRFEWKPPGEDWQPVAPERFAHDARALTPPADEPPPGASAERGAELWAAQGCAGCHEDGAPPPPAPPLLALAPALEAAGGAAGCVAEDPQPGLPHRALDPQERAGLAAALALWPAVPEPDAGERADRTLAEYGCLACHARGGVGGPAPDRLAHFTTTEELGDEGRIPPPLDGVGAKLRPAWLARVIGEGASVRPYMKVRMPVFRGPAVEALPALLREADGPVPGAAPPFDPERVEVGRSLVGAQGFSCFACHDVAGHASLGVRAMDLAVAATRLEPSWFRAYLLEPARLRPGTRMPGFWNPQGQVFPDRLGGDPVAQVDAVYSYLSLGESMPLPQGLVVDPDGYRLVPVDRPLLFGTFLEDVGPRVLGVGFPERVHYAYDMAAGRTVRLWRGDFLDARGTWEGRAGQLATPPGEAVVALPEQPLTGGLSGVAVGRSLEPDGTPVFRSRVGEVALRERLRPELAPGGAHLLRRFEAVAPPGSAPALRALRVLDGAGLEALDGGGFRNAAGVSVLPVDGASLRLSEDGAVLADLPWTPDGRAAVELRYAW